MTVRFRLSDPTGNAPSTTLLLLVFPATIQKGANDMLKFENYKAVKLYCKIRKAGYDLDSNGDVMTVRMLTAARMAIKNNSDKVKKGDCLVLARSPERPRIGF